MADEVKDEERKDGEGWGGMKFNEQREENEGRMGMNRDASIINTTFLFLSLYYPILLNSFMLIQYLFIPLSIYPSIHPSIYPSIHPSLYLSISSIHPRAVLVFIITT